MNESLVYNLLFLDEGIQLEYHRLRGFFRAKFSE